MQHHALKLAILELYAVAIPVLAFEICSHLLSYGYFKGKYYDLNFAFPDRTVRASSVRISAGISV